MTLPHPRHRDDSERFGTGCPTIDDALAGGFRPRQTAQIYGEAGAGKTNLAAATAVRAAANGRLVAFITKDGTSLDRVLSFAEAHPDAHVDDILQNIQTSQVTDFEEQGDAIERVRDLENGFSLIVFDGIGGSYRTARNRTDTSERRVERLFTRQITLLRAVARRDGAAVVVTNQVYYNPDEEDVEPLGGAGLQNWFDTVLRVDSFQNGKHTLLVEKHRQGAEGERAWFKITGGGIVPVTPSGSGGFSPRERS